MKKQHSKAHNK